MAVLMELFDVDRWNLSYRKVVRRTDVMIVIIVVDMEFPFLGCTRF